MRFPWILIVILLSSSMCTAAFIYGDIYKSDLERLNDTVIKVEGPYSYQFVTDKPNYSFFLQEGEYRLTASSYDESGNLAFFTDETIKVGSQDQKVDLVLKPMKSDLYLYAGILIVLAVAFLWSNHHWQRKREAGRPKAPGTVRRTELDDDAKRVLAALDGHEGRATQKELRQDLRYSDAKLSLILTELEQLGHVKKFRRGRANIVKKLA